MKTTPERLKWPEWKPEYSVGVATLDSHHRYMFELGTRMVGLQPENAQPFAEALYEYLVEHCAAEEAHMATIGFPGLATHREKHVQLLAQMKSSVDNVGINPRGVLKLKAFFFNWLVDHVLNEDRRYYEFEKLHPLS